MPNFLGFRVDDRDLLALEGLSAGLKEVVEIGSCVGISALSLLAGGATVHCIDTWEGTRGDPIDGLYSENGGDKVFRAFCENMGHLLFRRVFPHRGTSLTYAGIWPRQVDLVFIDGAHDYENVKADIKAWTPHVKPGGILCGHDYGVSFLPGVKEAVDEAGCDGVINTVWWKRL